MAQNIKIFEMTVKIYSPDEEVEPIHLNASLVEYGTCGVSQIILHDFVLEGWGTTSEIALDDLRARLHECLHFWKRLPPRTLRLSRPTETEQKSDSVKLLTPELFTALRNSYVHGLTTT